jgi:hypothetical protein
MEPAKIVTYFNNLRTRENTAARKRIKALYCIQQQQYETSIADNCGHIHIPEFLLAQVMINYRRVLVKATTGSIRAVCTWMEASNVSSNAGSVQKLANNA